ncbi:DUF4864 domain-containing protein [Haloarcula marina]|uniref:DUF4864 domain-containing protein n=1 Tax=Haloarcula marina TaxID=2961574 RepID=UPI0020B73D39|nr:DUF4864 domain-containing protein [Halomicroarcula marina]
MSRGGPLVVLLLAAALLLAGCGELLGTGGSADEPAVTPAPVPETAVTPTPTPTPTPEPNGRSLAGGASQRGHWVGVVSDANRTASAQGRYLSLRPTCDRPPGLVVHIQVNALQNDDPVTHAGVNATWRFMALSYRSAFGSYEDFVDVVTSEYRPLLSPATVTYEPLVRDGAFASQRVKVTDGNETSVYTWRLELQMIQTIEPYGGCWMTTSITAS